MYYFDTIKLYILQKKKYIIKIGDYSYMRLYVGLVQRFISGKYKFTNNFRVKLILK